MIDSGMEKKSVPFERTAFVCVNVREGGRKACANPGVGGDKVCEMLKSAVKAAGLKGKVRVARSGCLDLCEKGPNVFLYPSGQWFSGVSQSDVPEILKKLAP